MDYLAYTWMEGTATLAEFPDAPGCQTFSEPGQNIEDVAAEALTGWLETTLQLGRTPPLPSAKLPRRKGKRTLRVSIPSQLGIKVSMRAARQERGMTQAQLAKVAGVSQPAIAQVESPDSNPTVATLSKVAKALGYRLEMGLAKA